MIERTIQIDGKPVRLRSSAMLPRIYRAKFGRDLFKDFNDLDKDFKKNRSKKKAPAEDEPETDVENVEEENIPEETGSTISAAHLEVFENIAYAMAWHADPSTPDIEEWLEQFNIFSIYEVMPVIVTMWNASLKTSVVPKKKSGRRRRRKSAN